MIYRVIDWLCRLFFTLLGVAAIGLAIVAPQAVGPIPAAAAVIFAVLSWVDVFDKRK